MNRKEKRNMEKKFRHNGATPEQAKDHVMTMEKIHEIIRSGSGTPSHPKTIEEGAAVRMDLEKIMKRKNYEKMSVPYKEFVTQNADTVFTAHVEDNNLISFVEEPKWLFWSGDLEVISDELST